MWCEGHEGRASCAFLVTIWETKDDCSGLGKPGGRVRGRDQDPLACPRGR